MVREKVGILLIFTKYGYELDDLFNSGKIYTAWVLHYKGLQVTTYKKN